MAGTILVIDDDIFTRRLIDLVLGKDFLLLMADDSKIGLHYAKTAAPLVILLDIHLPGEMNGMEILDSLKTNSITKDIPVIMMTGEDYMSIAECQRRGAENYFTKPFSPYQLAAAIKDIVNK